MLTVSALHGRVHTAESLLEWFVSKAERTSKAWKSVPLLITAVGLVETVIRKIKKEGVRNIDPVDARIAGDELRKVSEAIRGLLVRADVMNAYEHLPFRVFLPILKRQGETLGRFAREFYEIDDQWNTLIAIDAAENKKRMRIASDTISLDHADCPEEASPAFSDAELQAHLHHTVKHTN